MASAVEDALIQFELLPHLSGITTDNASNNDTICQALEKSPFTPSYWTQKDHHVRCIAHVLNLSAQKLITTLKAEAKEVESQMADEKECAFHKKKTLVPGNVIKKVRRIAAKVRVSYKLYEAL